MYVQSFCSMANMVLLYSQATSCTDSITLISQTRSLVTQSKEAK